MRIILVYAGSPRSRELQSPYSITRELHRYLSARAEVVYYDWCYTGPVLAQPGDLVLGHPNYDPRTPIQQLLRQRCRAKCLLLPLHHGLPEYNLPFDPLVAQADRVFALMGPYWYDTLEQSQFAHWRPKLVRLDMAVDPVQFPFCRQRFRPPGQRRLVYIGRAGPEKNLELLRQLLLHSGYELDWYGGQLQHPLAQVPGVRVFDWCRLDAARARQLVERADILLSPSCSDACPTTLLEALAWGLIPMCTRQSGYYPDGVLWDELVLDDLDTSLRNLHQLQHVPEPILLERARQSRRVLEANYGWERFCGTIWGELQPLL